MQRYMIEVTQLEAKLKQARKILHFNGEQPQESDLVRMCSECLGLIHQTKDTPILLTDFQAGYFYALLSKGHHKVTHGYCKPCYDKIIKLYRELQKEGSKGK